MTNLAESIERTLEQVRDTTLGREDVIVLLADFARHLGVEQLELDEQGATEITVDGEVDVTLIHLPQLPGLVAAAAVAEATADGGDLARRLLQANLSWAVTQGGTFARLPGRPELMLCRLIALPTRDVQQLDRELAAFVDLVRTWRDEIEDLTDDDDDDATIDDRPPATPDFIRV